MQPMKSLATAVTRPIATAFRPMTSMFSGRMVRQCHSCNRNSEDTQKKVEKQLDRTILGLGAFIIGYATFNFVGAAVCAPRMANERLLRGDMG